jgi:hypothetical protein
MERKAELRWPAFVQLFLLAIQTIYLLLFYGNPGGFTGLLAFHGDAMMFFSFATCVLAFTAYWIGFSRNTLQQRILFACLFLFHLAVASYSFYITLGAIISRC